MAADSIEPDESLETLQRRLIAQKYDVSIEEVVENLDRRGCSCQWTPEFRAKIEAVIRSNNDPSHEVEVVLDCILGRHNTTERGIDQWFKWCLADDT